VWTIRAQPAPLPMIDEPGGFRAVVALQFFQPFLP
jgi:hypothetical protein